ncbi:MAG TPA: thioredoxin domain-containing protein [Ktedonobacterales bacterium]|nr:thioredoxin domain-containing protein [Ktedonobacterales bacterium]
MSNQHHEAGAPLQEHTNRLIHETSPYLLQHAHNPVDWYPWGDDALARAKREDKPILLSIGYASCHWCHVMAHESFENEDTARLMNDSFVSIKVDREERPDVDALYMDAVQALTGSGGWPMTVFLTPDGAPFFGGTYFPPVDRYGMPGFPRLLRSIAALYSDRRDDVERQADEFRTFFQARGQVQLTLPENISPSAAIVNPSVLFQAADRLLAQMDALEGGFGRAPKFPHPMGLEFLLRIVSRSQPAYPDSEGLLELLRLTLDKMAGGGIYDQIGGGFHRYSTDTYWVVPHFEKMLYDNALLAPVYLHAWQHTGDEHYRHICEETLDYVLREMTDSTGGFYSTQDADSEGEEGKFYIWTPAELRTILGARDCDIMEDLWGFSERGNFEGRNILHVARSASTVAAEHDMSEVELSGVVARARQQLYDARAKRVWPALDDKILASWNGLMLRAFAEAARALDRNDYRQAAIRNATFLTTALMPEGRLRRSWRTGQARLDAYLEDYAAAVNGLLSTYETTGETRFFTSARALADTMIERFWDAESGAFFDTARDAEQLIGRPRELTDNATPSGTSLAAEALLRLAAFTGADRYRELAVRVIVPLAPAMADSPSGFGHLLCALDDFAGPFHEIAIVGAAASPDRAALLDVIAHRYLPRQVLAYATPEDAEAQSSIPLLAGRGLVDDRAAAYVCQHFVCQQPATDPKTLLSHLKPLGAPPSSDIE